MMDIDCNPPASVPIAAPTTVINISQWDIDGDRIHGKTSFASIEDPMVESAPSATDPTTQPEATFHYDIEVESTFHDADEDISPEHDTRTSAKRSFLAVSHFLLTTITAVLNFSFLRITRCWHGSSTPKTFFLSSLDWMVGGSTKIN